MMAAGANFSALPLRDIVLFPGAMVPLFVGRSQAVRAARRAEDSRHALLVLTQKSATDDRPGFEDLHHFGTLASIRQVLPLPDGTVKILVDTSGRMELVGFSSDGEAFEAQAKIATNSADATPASARRLKEAFIDYTVREAASSDRGNVIMRPSRAAPPISSTRWTKMISSCAPTRLQRSSRSTSHAVSPSWRRHLQWRGLPRARAGSPSAWQRFVPRITHDEPERTHSMPARHDTRGCFFCPVASAYDRR